MGRVCTFNQDIADELCRRFSEGLSLLNVCKAEDMPGLSTVYDWRDKYPGFAAQLKSAQERYADTIAMQITDIADTDHDPQRARNRMTARQWVSAKFNREKYGDRVDVNNTITVSISSMISDGMDRLRAICDQKNAIDIQPVEIEREKLERTSDRESDDL